MEESKKTDRERSATQKIIDISIQLALLALLLLSCVQILRPFILPVIWGIIIAITLYPVYEVLNAKIGDRRKLTAALMTILALMVIILPGIHLSVSTVDTLQYLSEQLKNGSVKVPPPPDGVAEWPVIGKSVQNLWQTASINLESTLVKYQPQVTEVAKWLLNTFLGIAGGVLMFAIALIIAGIFMASSRTGGRMAKRFLVRLIGERGIAMADMAIQTIRGVVKGIIGVSIIQALLAGLGFAVAGIPAAGLWAFLCLVLAIIQIGIGPVVIGVVIYAFSTMGKLAATALTVWLIVVAVSDGPMKAVLLGRGAMVPMPVIFLGAIGGFMAIGFLGLFIGAVVLSVGYKLFDTWLQEQSPVDPGADLDATPK
jgi:predicted PurR-regulated permease PerM